MKKILTLSALAATAISLTACAGPDKCIDDLDCGVGAYSEERTVLPMSMDTYKHSTPVDESPMAEPSYEAAAPAPAPAPAPEPVMEEINEPVQGTADAMFDERLTK